MHHERHSPIQTARIAPTVEPLRVRRREVNEALEARARNAGLPPSAVRVLASRDLPSDIDIDIDKFVNPTLNILDRPELLFDMEPAANRLAAAAIGREHISIQRRAVFAPRSERRREW